MSWMPRKTCTAAIWFSHCNRRNRKARGSFLADPQVLSMSQAARSPAPQSEDQRNFWSVCREVQLVIATATRELICRSRRIPPYTFFAAIHDIQDLQLGRPSRAISRRKDLTQLSPPVRWFRLCRIPHDRRRTDERTGAAPSSS